MRRIESYVRKYGPEVGPRLYQALQSQAAHAGVSARLRRKIEALSGRPGPSAAVGDAGDGLPLFPGFRAEAGDGEGAEAGPRPMAVGA